MQQRVKSKGDGKIILIMNEEFGGPDKGLPFDLAHKRWPIVYKLGKDANTEEFKSQQKQLISQLVNAVKLILRQATSTKGSLPILAVNPSQENIEQVILYSDPINDWEHQSINDKTIARYKRDVNLRFEINYTGDGIQQKDFQEEWANSHPDPKARGYWCDLYYNQSLIERFVLVSVDGGRAMLPIPKEGGIGYWDQVLLLDYKVAEIHDALGTLSQYMARSKLTISDSDT
jgi:hypothetical protein